LAERCRFVAFLNCHTFLLSFSLSLSSKTQEEVIEKSVVNKMNTLTPTSLCNTQISRFRFTAPKILRNSFPHAHSRAKSFKIHATTPSEIDTQTAGEERVQAESTEAFKASSTPSTAPAELDKDLKKVGPGFICMFEFLKYYLFYH
jgi:hypothetical protein